MFCSTKLVINLFFENVMINNEIATKKLLIKSCGHVDEMNN